jgi:hypothetical protein
LDEIREALESYDVEDMHACEAEKRTLEGSIAPKSKRLGPEDRLHMKYAGEKPGINEKAVFERMSRMKSRPRGV